MRSGAAVAIAILLVSAPGIASADGTVMIRVFSAGAAPRSDLDAVRVALEKGVRAAGAQVVPAPSTPEETCDERCEDGLRRLAAPNKLLVARLNEADHAFVLMISTGSAHISASADSSHLEEAATEAAWSALSIQGYLVLSGASSAAEIWLDGSKVTWHPRIAVFPGDHVVRIGDGTGSGRMALAHIVAGGTVELAFPDMSTGPSTVFVQPAQTPAMVSRPTPTRVPAVGHRRAPLLVGVGAAILAGIGAALVAAQPRPVHDEIDKTTSITIQ